MTEQQPEVPASEPRKCRAVKQGVTDLQCTEPEDHDRPAEGKGTWHTAVFTEHRDIAYDGARHSVDIVERVTWEPVDHAGEAARHIIAATRRDT
jgi:hypothetical protein